MEPEIAAGRWEGRSAAEWQAEWGIPRLELFARVRSTNDVARRLAEGAAPAGTVVIAEEQTAGRGRGGRRWHAVPHKSLLLSVVLRPPRSAARDAAPGVIPLRVGLAAAQAVERVASTSVGLKWPNDLLAPDGRKFAGVLCEAASAGAAGGFVIAGIGINVLQQPGDWPAELESAATSLALVCGGIVSRARVAGAVIQEVLRRAGGPSRPLSDRALAELRRRDVLRGRPVAVDGVARGTAAGIDADGALLLRTRTGRIRIHGGTVRPLGPSPSLSRKAEP